MTKVFHVKDLYNIRLYVTHDYFNKCNSSKYTVVLCYEPLGMGSCTLWGLCSPSLEPML